MNRGITYHFLSFYLVHYIYYLTFNSLKGTSNIFLLLLTRSHREISGGTLILTGETPFWMNNVGCVFPMVIWTIFLTANESLSSIETTTIGKTQPTLLMVLGTVRAEYFSSLISLNPRPIKVIQIDILTQSIFIFNGSWSEEWQRLQNIGYSIVLFPSIKSLNHGSSYENAKITNIKLVKFLKF